VQTNWDIHEPEGQGTSPEWSHNIDDCWLQPRSLQLRCYQQRVHIAMWTVVGCRQSLDSGSALESVTFAVEKKGHIRWSNLSENASVTERMNT
jgi:hypothetical protein